MIGGHGPALSLVTEGTAYVNRVRDVLRRRVVTFDGFWPVKKPRVPEEVSGAVVERGRLSLVRTGPQSVPRVSSGRAEIEDEVPFGLP